jgi:hypothetical protein
MDPRDRVSTLAADIARLVRETPDPHHSLGQLILALEGSIVELRREAVAGVVRRKRIEQRLGLETHSAASRRALEAELAREGRHVIELLQTQIETRALSLRRERDAMSASPDGRMPRAH